MAFLEKYQAVEVERAPGQDALERAKHTLINAINGQIENVKNPGQLNGRGKPIRDWSFRDDDGNLYTQIRFGTRPIEFQSGKSFLIATPEDLIPFYSDVVEAVESGELDEIIDKARKIGARGHGHKWGHGKRGRRHRKHEEA